MINKLDLSSLDQLNFGNHCYSKLRDLEYKTAIVTGSGRGIGKETAILLSKMGLNVVLCSRTQKEIDSTVKEIKEIVKNTKHGNGTITAAKEDGILGYKM
jgi:NAD(P)-dependent dehydrogenase (short-subunit alcohol dehydrogenase family)